MSSTFSSLERKNILQSMENITFDVLIIGGGITGAGIALDAATRGMKTALVEMQDFAAGTSSRSTKLVHGGLRYLKQFEVQMVAEVGKERAIVYENGPHVTTPEWMLLPIHKGGTFGMLSTSVGLKVYDYLAGVKGSERRKMLSTQTTMQKEPLLKKENLLGGGYYVEYRTDDARLTIEVLKAAVAYGAKAASYLKVEDLIYKDGKVIGIQAVDQLDGQKFSIYGRKIVNATGPWVDTLREKDKSKTGKKLQHSKGVHLVIDQKRFPLKQAIYFDTPDKRMVFAIPRDGKAYVGTTDTFYSEDLVHPRMTEEDRAYIIRAINYMFPDVNITENDIESSWAGVRPLIYEEGKSASEISRKDEIWVSPSGLITIAGGKLTGYRKMAETVVSQVASLLQSEGNGSYKECITKHLPISGGDVGGSANYGQFIQAKVQHGLSLGLTSEQANWLVRMYGSNVDQLFHIVSERKKELSNENSTTTLPLDLYAALVYGMEYEMVVSPVDFFVRRTGKLFFDIQTVQQWKDQVIAFMAERMGWSDEVTIAYTNELNVHLHDAVTPEKSLVKA
ncbi:glycerol-3-phosphate dehydrogenase/oxidase [Brevibacillus sp. SYSU BS000544]|uniref:glycerol-3-phosphate dehydrogenase/oxidase n=1 Tax=Brevibacillus sp. SYSU BS000544 TaxID=3416443 RepID=UPI003CE4574C